VYKWDRVHNFITRLITRLDLRGHFQRRQHWVAAFWKETHTTSKETYVLYTTHHSYALHTTHHSPSSYKAMGSGVGMASNVSFAWECGSLLRKMWVAFAGMWLRSIRNTSLASIYKAMGSGVRVARGLVAVTIWFRQIFSKVSSVVIWYGR